MRKAMLFLFSSIVFSLSVFAADITNQIESLSKTFSGFQHTNIIQPDSSSVVWQQFGVVAGDVGRIFTSRVPLGANLIPFPNDISRNLTFESAGKMKIEVQGIQARKGFVSEVIQLDNNKVETTHCVNFLTQIKILEIDQPALISMRRGDRFGLDLPVEPDQTRLLELKEIHLNQNGEVSKTIHHGGSSPGIIFDPANRCFELEGFVSGGSKILEATYYAVFK